jgi:hypothetical protein
MPDRHFPVRPNLEQLKHRAKDLLRAEPSLGKLAHAQHTRWREATGFRAGRDSCSPAA